MEKKKEPSPISVVWGWAEKYHSKFYGSVVLAVLGVAGTMAAYFSIAAMIRILLENGDFSQCLPWCGLLLIGYLVKSVGFCMVHVHVPYSNLLYSAGYP